MASSTETLAKRIGIACVATHGLVDEFEVMKYSFELFHEGEFHWFVRCDRKTSDALSKYPKVHCTVFSEDLPAVSSSEDGHKHVFNHIVGQKMHAMEDAWNYRAWESVIFLDSDLIVTAAFLNKLVMLPGDVILSPHHYPACQPFDHKKYGFFNSGFLAARTRRFHRWWEQEFQERPFEFTDQQCLDRASKYFQVGSLGRTGNIGLWRGSVIDAFPPIPRDCMFLHFHVFHSAMTGGEFVKRAFADVLAAYVDGKTTPSRFTLLGQLNRAYGVHCLSFLGTSKKPEHQALFREILLRDKLGLYSAVLTRLLGSKASLSAA